ncbi:MULTISPECIES: DNA-binding protein [Bacteroides]|uniref:DNA-binding protein n=1 Tax=Bacteroides TaxID=816 RepID=UPI00259CFCC3|nr:MULTISPECIES: DNA-binding protein [Bacteroides]
MGRTRKTVKVEPAPKRWLNKQEAMAYLGVGEDYLQGLRENAEVSFYQKGRMIWYELAGLDRFVLKNKVV